jgi:hypothetical protein
MGGLVAGARPEHPPPPPAPVYVDEYAGPPVYCHWERRPVFDVYGEYMGSRPVRNVLASISPPIAYVG